MKKDDIRVKLTLINLTFIRCGQVSRRVRALDVYRFNKQFQVVKGSEAEVSPQNSDQKQ